MLLYKIKLQMTTHVRLDEGRMKICYKKLWVMLAEREMSKQEFREELKYAAFYA